jgi:hypothetical protein
MLHAILVTMNESEKIARLSRQVVFPWLPFAVVSQRGGRMRTSAYDAYFQCVRIKMMAAHRFPTLYIYTLGAGLARGMWISFLCEGHE